MSELPRRQFLTGLAALIAAPAIVRAENLMPVRSLRFDPYVLKGKLFVRSGDMMHWTAIGTGIMSIGTVAESALFPSLDRALPQWRPI